jgi:putative CocE/NonD family hydrolase
MRTPYDKGPRSNEAKFIASRGYVVAVQDVRGRYKSEGEWFAMMNERSDGTDTINWIGKQKWCNGKVGMHGGSYLGFVQWCAAAGKSRYLKSIAVQVAGPDLYDVFHRNGAMSLWTLEWFLKNNVQGKGWKKPEVDLGDLFMTLPVVNLKKKLPDYDLDPFFEYMGRETRDSWWDPISPSKEFYDKIEIAALSVGGWYDIFSAHSFYGYLKVINSSAPDEIKKKQFLLMGPWGHGGVPKNANPRYLADDIDETLKYRHSLIQTWHDVHLKGENPEKLGKPVQLYVMGRDQWRIFDSWPLTGVQNKNLYLHSNGEANTLSGDGVLSLTPAAGEEKPDLFSYNPLDPVPNSKQTLNELATQIDWRKVEKRKDVLVYTTDVLKNGIEVIGIPKLLLFASTSAVDTDWTARLIDVYEDGYAKEVSYGIVRARFNKSVLEPELLEPDKIYEYLIEMNSTGCYFKKGHRVRVEVSSSNFPYFDRNMNTGNPVGKDSSDKAILAVQKIFHDSKYSSCLVLPVLEGK